MRQILTGGLVLLFVTLPLTACLPAGQSRHDAWQSLRQPDGSVLWLDEYRFVPPPEPWLLLNLDDRDFSLALYKPCSGQGAARFPCEATMAYAEEPFGYSRDLELRAGEFLKRYLWASRVVFSAPQKTMTTVNNRPALVVDVAGEEPVTHYRLRSRIVFTFRGERVVAFFTNQWRGDDTPFSAGDFSDFDRFVESFQFTKPSFYEELRKDAL